MAAVKISRLQRPSRLRRHWFFTVLYGKRGHDCSLNTLRQHMLASSRSDLRMLSPTDDAFNLHLLRALYQLTLYKTAHLSNPALPPVTEFGQVLINGRLCPLLMTIPAKPNIQQPVSCKCKKSKCSSCCFCIRAGVLCCVRCSCLGSVPTCGSLTADILHQMKTTELKSVEN